MNKIAFIIPYYGRFKNYFKIWVQSVGKNPLIDFYIVTDIDISFELPENIKIVRKSFEKLREEIQGLFDFKIALETPYKLCEYKPVYGILFKEMLREYEFWGYCDTDVVWGDISKFFTDEVLKNNDVILSHGHCMLIRNKDYLNKMFQQKNELADYKKVFTSNIIYHFDEWGGVSNTFKMNKIPMYDEVIFADIRYQKFDFRLAQGEYDGNKRMYEWNNGKLLEYTLNSDGIINQREVMYIHLQKRKMIWDEIQGNRYVIYPNEIVAVSDEINAEMIKKKCKGKIIYTDYLKLRYSYCKNKLIMIIKEKYAKRGE